VDFGDTVVTYPKDKEFKVRPSLPRALFIVALVSYSILNIQYNISIFRIEDELDGGFWSFRVPITMSFLPIALLALPIFFTGKKPVAVISVLWVYLINLPENMVLLQRDLIDPLSAFFLIPTYTLELSFESLILGSGGYLRFIGFSAAIIGTVLTFVGVQQGNPRSTSVGPKLSAPPIFVAARDSSKQLAHINTPDGIDQVERLGNLLKKGLITQEEFDFKKRQILGL
jgi:hypothetical protein